MSESGHDPARPWVGDDSVLQRVRERFADEFEGAEYGRALYLDSAQGSPLEKLLESYRREGEESIAKWWHHPLTRPARVRPVYVDYTASLSMNAWATDCGEYTFIGISLGTMLLLHQLFFWALSDRRVFPGVGNLLQERETIPQVPIFGPDGRAHAAVSSSVWTSEMIVPRDQTRRELAVDLVRIAFWMLLEHEHAHLRYGHVRFLNRHFGLHTLGEDEETTDPRLSRLTRQTLEWDADSWGLNRTLTPTLAMVGDVRESDKYKAAFSTMERASYTWGFATYACLRLLGRERLDHHSLAQVEYQPPALRQLNVLLMADARLRRSYPDFVEIVPPVLVRAMRDVELALSFVTGEPPLTLDNWADDVFDPRSMRLTSTLNREWAELRPELDELAWGIELVAAN